MVRNDNTISCVVVNDFPDCAIPFKIHSIVELPNGDTTETLVVVEFTRPVYDFIPESKGGSSLTSLPISWKEKAEQWEIHDAAINVTQQINNIFLISIVV